MNAINHLMRGYLLRWAMLALLFPLTALLGVQAQGTNNLSKIGVSATTTPSLCANDGTLQVLLSLASFNVHGYDQHSVRFDLVPLDGQSDPLPQDSDLFSTLFPGRYKVQISARRASENVVDTYTYPAIYTVENKHVPLKSMEAVLAETYGAYPCTGTPQGKITLKIKGGRLPFTFKIKSPGQAEQAVTPTLTTVDHVHTAVFPNLSNGQHTIKVEDACVSGAATTVDLASPGLPLPRAVVDDVLPTMVRHKDAPDCGFSMELYSALIETNPGIKAQFEAGNLEVGIAPKGQEPTQWIKWERNERTGTWTKYHFLPFGTYKSSDFWGRWSATDRPQAFNDLIKANPSATLYVRLKNCPGEPMKKQDFYVPLPTIRLKEKYTCEGIKISAGIYPDFMGILCFPVKTYVVPYDEASSLANHYNNLDGIALTNDKGQKYYEITRPREITDNLDLPEPNGGFDHNTWLTKIEEAQKYDVVLVDASGKQVVWRHARSYTQTSSYIRRSIMVMNWEKVERRGCNSYKRRYYMNVDDPEAGTVCEGRIVQVYDVTNIANENERKKAGVGTFLWEETLEVGNAATQMYEYQPGHTYRLDFYCKKDVANIADHRSAEFFNKRHKEKVESFALDPNPKGFVFFSENKYIQSCSPHRTSILEVYTLNDNQQGNLDEEITITGPGLTTPLTGKFKTRYGQHHRDWHLRIELKDGNNTLMPGTYTVSYNGPCGVQEFQVEHKGIARAQGFKLTPTQTCNGMTIKCEGLVEYYEVNLDDKYRIISQGYVAKPKVTYYRIIDGPTGYDKNAKLYKAEGTFLQATTPGVYTVAIGSKADMTADCNYATLQVTVGSPQPLVLDGLATQGLWCDGALKGLVTAQAKHGGAPYKYELLNSNQQVLNIWPDGIAQHPSPNQALPADQLAVFSHGALNDVYWIKVTDACGSFTSLRVEIKPVSEMVPFFETEVNTCQDEDYEFTPRLFPAGTTFQWSYKSDAPGAAEVAFSTERILRLERPQLPQSGTYTFTATLPNGGCVISKPLKVNVVRCYLRTNRHITTSLK